MSINPEDFSKVLDNLQEQRNRIIEIIGLDLIVSDHYGRCLLFNENIKHDTPDEDITKIY